MHWVVRARRCLAYHMDSISQYFSYRESGRVIEIGCGGTVDCGCHAIRLNQFLMLFWPKEESSKGFRDWACHTPHTKKGGGINILKSPTGFDGERSAR